MLRKKFFRDGFVVEKNVLDKENQNLNNRGRDTFDLRLKKWVTKMGISVKYTYDCKVIGPQSAASTLITYSDNPKTIYTNSKYIESFKGKKIRIEMIPGFLISCYKNIVLCKKKLLQLYK